MTFLTIKEDAQRAFEVLRGGGIAILPMDVGYSLIGGSGAALRKIFDIKRRTPNKLNAMVGNDDIANELYLLGPRGRDVIDAITKEYDLPLGAVAPCRADQPMLKALNQDTFERSTRGGTLLMLLNAGRFHAEITRLSHEHQFPLFGSSANLSLSGTKFHPRDIEPEIKAIADIVIDYGLRKYHPYKASATILNVETFEVVRFGCCYEDIADICKRHFGAELPPPPKTA